MTTASIIIVCVLGFLVIGLLGIFLQIFLSIGYFILEYLAKSKLKLSEIVAKIPVYKVVKAKKQLVSPTQVAEVLAKTKAYYKDAKIDETDGVKVIFKDSWLHVRASNTEPIVRYFAEAKDLKTAQQLVDNIF